MPSQPTSRTQVQKSNSGVSKRHVVPLKRGIKAPKHSLAKRRFRGNTKKSKRVAAKQHTHTEDLLQDIDDTELIGMGLFNTEAIKAKKEREQKERLEKELRQMAEEQVAKEKKQKEFNNDLLKQLENLGALCV